MCNINPLVTVLKFIVQWYIFNRVNNMKHSVFIILAAFFFSHVYGQQKDVNKKSWIKISSEDLSATSAVGDTAYTRYTFDNDLVNVSFEPAWDGITMNWQYIANGIRIGFQDYTINESTDTSLILEAPGFRRIKLLAEEYLIRKSEMPIAVDTLNGKPVYLANKIITARFQKGKSLSNELEKYSHGYNIRKLSKLRIAFIVDERGFIQNIKVLEGITEGLDNSMVEAISKTSKKWKPARYNGTPIQTLMFFESRYINTAPGGILKNQ
jgi:hypothetical protein